MLGAQQTPAETLPAASFCMLHPTSFITMGLGAIQTATHLSAKLCGISADKAVEGEINPFNMLLK